MPSASPSAAETVAHKLPDITVSVRQTFGIDSDLQVPAFSTPTEHVPDVTTPISRPRHDARHPAGFAYNRRVMVQGYHGTGNRLISSRSRLASTGPACASISTAISAVST